MLLIRNLVGLRLDIPRGQSETRAHFFQLFPGTLNRLACVHWRESYPADSFLSSYVAFLSIHGLRRHCSKSCNWSQLRPVDQFFALGQRSPRYMSRANGRPTECIEPNK